MSGPANLPRISPVEPPFSADTARMLEKWMPPGSPVPPLGIFRTIARHPQLAERMRPLGAGLLGHGKLPPRVRELLVLRTCARCQAEYEWGVHVTAFSGAIGLDAEAAERTRLASPEAIAASAEPDDAILRLADELHDEGQVTKPTWEILATRFDDESLLEMLVVVGFYHLISFVVNGAEVAPEPWAARFPLAAG